MLKSKVSLIIIFSLLFLVVLYEGYISGKFLMIPFLSEPLTKYNGEQEVFALKVDLTKDSQQVVAGDTLYFTTKIYNLGNQEKVDFLLRYEIIDSSNTVKTFKSETVALQTQASFVGELAVPTTLTAGDYTLRVLLEAPSGERTAQTFFTVVNPIQQEQLIKHTLSQEVYYKVGLFLAVLILLYLLIKRSLANKERNKSSKNCY